MNTWLCTFEVRVDLPTTLTPFEMESLIAQSISVRMPALGYPGNCVVTLIATAGNVSVFNIDGTGSVVATPNPGVTDPLPVTPIDTTPAPVDTTNPSQQTLPSPKIAPPEPAPSPIPVNPIGAV